MAIVLMGSPIHHFAGLSSDVKPVDQVEGSTFHVVDTGEQYVYHNGGWEPDLRMVYAVKLALSANI